MAVKVELHNRTLKAYNGLIGFAFVSEDTKTL
jgi:hypothetical protein